MVSHVDVEDVMSMWVRIREVGVDKNRGYQRTLKSR